MLELKINITEDEGRRRTREKKKRNIKQKKLIFYDNFLAVNSFLSSIF